MKPSQHLGAVLHVLKSLRLHSLCHLLHGPPPASFPNLSAYLSHRLLAPCLLFRREMRQQQRLLQQLGQYWPVRFIDHCGGFNHEAIWVGPLKSSPEQTLDLLNYQSRVSDSRFRLMLLQRVDLHTMSVHVPICQEHR